EVVLTRAFDGDALRLGGGVPFHRLSHRSSGSLAASRAIATILNMRSPVKKKWCARAYARGMTRLGMLVIVGSLLVSGAARAEEYKCVSGERIEKGSSTWGYAKSANGDWRIEKGSSTVRCLVGAPARRPVIIRHHVHCDEPLPRRPGADG